MDSELRDEERPVSPAKSAASDAEGEEEKPEVSEGVRVAAPEAQAEPPREEPPAEKLEPAPVTPEPLEKRIKAMKDEQAKLKAEKAKVGKELKVMEKKRNRLKKRARQLSDHDLLEVVHMRKTSKVEKEEAAAAASKKKEPLSAPDASSAR